MSNAKIIIAKRGKDALTDLYKEMSLHTDLNIQKLVRGKGETYTAGFQGILPEPAVIEHGLGYPPEVITMEEFSANASLSGLEGTSVDYSPSFLHNRAGKDVYWYCPQGVTTVYVSAWGGGGAGGGMTTDNVAGCGGGGAGGQCAWRTLSVTPGTTYRVRLGAGGVGSTGNGGNGGDTIFGSNLVVAKGGAGGKSYENGGTGGVGSTSGGVGDTVRRGGNGGVFHSTPSYSGVLAEGGGVGGSSSGGHAPGSAYPNPGGKGYGPDYTLYFGDGAMGIPASTDGFDGYDTGGGGGGGGNVYDFYTNNRKGGNGGMGFLRLVYFRTHNNPRYFGNIGMGGDGSAVSVNDTEIQLYPGWKNIYSSSYFDIAPVKMWAYILLDPLQEPVEHIAPLKGNRPVVRVRSGGRVDDYATRMNTYYDTLKVAKTGRLSVTAPQFYAANGQNLEQIVEAKVPHGLGYFPMFAPFVNSKVNLDSYIQWLGQYYGAGNWMEGRQYLSKEVVVSNYQCIRSHISTAASRPGVGAEWQTYWKTPSDIIAMDNLLLNDIEDVKLRFGGIVAFNLTDAEFYVTDTDIVLRLVRIPYDAELYWDSPNETLSPLTIHVDYTIFYNRADQEFDLLTS